MAALVNLDEQRASGNLDASAAEEHTENTGDSKLPDPYANTAGFWLDFFCLGLFGAGLGAFGFCFLSAFEHFSEWVVEDFFRNHYLDEHTWDFGDGQYHWIGICAAFGLVVGVLRVVLAFPDTYPNFLLEVQHQRADWWLSMRVCLLGLLSLMSGATVGPEAPLGSMGAGLGNLLSDCLGHKWGMQTKYAVLAGMAGAMAVIFPSPLFGVLMLLELGVGTWDPDELWKQVTLTTVCACSSFAVYLGCVSNGNTYLHPDGGIGAAGLTVGWENWYLFAAIPLGLYSAVVGVISIVLYKLTEKVVLGLKQRCAARFNKNAVTILFPAIFGAISGCINVLFPLSYGDGSLQMKEIITEGDHMGAGILIGNAFAKLVCLGLAQGSGFVGGFFFPMFYVGGSAGVLAHLALEPSTYVNCLLDDRDWQENIVVVNGTGRACVTMTSDDGLNMHFAAVACLVAVPAAFVPFPFTLVCMAGFMMQLTAYQTTAVYIAVIVSSTIISGVGVPQRLMSARAPKPDPTQTAVSNKRPTPDPMKTSDGTTPESADSELEIGKDRHQL